MRFVSESRKRDHDRLVELFEEFRESLRPTLVGGVPDFTAPTMATQYRNLVALQARLAAIDVRDSSVAERVDYHTVRAEMNAAAFDHRVLRPWARDPGFYNPSDGIYPRLLVHPSKSLSDWGLLQPEPPLSEAEVADFSRRLRIIPPLLAQAECNLTEAADELAAIAIRIKEKDIELLERLRESLRGDHPALVPDVDAAITATGGFRDWLFANRSRMTASAGIGRERLHLVDEQRTSHPPQLRADRGAGPGRLRSRHHLSQTGGEQKSLRARVSPDRFSGGVDPSARRGHRRLDGFLRDEELLTLPDELEPLPRAQYPRVWGTSAYLRADDRGFFEETNDREPKTNVAHVFFGHYYVDGRKIWYQTGDERPIRGRLRIYDLHEARSEALAFGIEEWLLQAGFFDDRPRSREITYMWLAFRAIRALADLKMHSGEYSLEDARRSIAAGMPYGWAAADSDAVWWDTEETLRAPGHSTNYVVGRNMIQGMMATRARQLGADFSLRRFFDEFLRGGIVPIALTHWELTGEKHHISHVLAGA